MTDDLWNEVVPIFTNFEIRSRLNRTEARVLDLHRRVSALEARAPAEPPKPEREPGWYVIYSKDQYAPWCSWWDGDVWRLHPNGPRSYCKSERLVWIGPRLNIPDEKVTT